MRLAVPADGPQLLELERATPQGTRLVMHSERDDYFFRGRLFGNHHTVVAVDEDRVFGVLGATLKRVLIDGEERTGALFNDLRLHPDYRANVLGRHMLKAWITTERWAAEAGADLIYGMVKSDNDAMHLMQRHKDGYAFCGEMVVASRPVYRRRRVRVRPETVDLAAHNEEMGREVFRAYGHLALYPADLRDRYLTPEMAATGLFRCYRVCDGDSWASVGLYHVSRAIWTRVVRLPWYYNAIRSPLDTIRPVLPTPRIPREGGEIRYHHVFNHLVHGPRGLALWHELLAHASNVALDEGSSLLTGMFDPADPLYPEFRRGAMNTIVYHTGYRPIHDGRTFRIAPYAPDVRDMD